MLLRLVYYLHVLLAFSATSFAPLHTVSHRSAKTETARPEQSFPVVFANPGRSDATADDDKVDYDVTAVERARILSYRAAIGASAVLISVLALGDVAFLEGTGADIDGLVDQSTTALPVVAGATLLLCPVPRGVVETGVLLLGIATIGSGVVLSFTAFDVQAVSWTLAMLALMAVSIREIWYFGGEYKRECGITLFMLPFMLDLNNRILFTIPLCALGMSVLAAGKIFEPCREDLERSNSEFLSK